MKSVGITALGMLLLAGCAQQLVQKECEAPKEVGLEAAVLRRCPPTQTHL